MCLFVNCGDTNAHSTQATFRWRRGAAAFSAIGHYSMPNSSCGQLFLITYVISTERQCVEKSRIIIALLIDFSMRAAMPHFVEMTGFRLLRRT